MNTGDLWVVTPLAILAGGAILMYLVGRFITQRNEILALCTTLILGSALAAHGWLSVQTLQATAGTWPAWGHFAPGGVVLRATPPTLLMGSIALALGLFSALYSGRYMTLDQHYITYYPLLLLFLTGLLGMVSSADLFNLYLFCEMMSIAGYVLVAFRRRTDTAIEAGFKYLILGSVGTLMMAMGITLIYRQTGSVALEQPGILTGMWGRAGLIFLWVGLGVKSALVPLHTWLPDAYGNAPSSISALFSGIASQSAFYILLKISLDMGLPPYELGLAFLVISFVNMTLGNLMALMQTNVKRLLAYSSIAQTGYVLFGVGIGLRYGIPEAIQAGFFLILTQAVAKSLAFLGTGVADFYCGTSTIADLRGIARRLPLTAILFGIALASLVGLPPLVGFTGKWFLLAETLPAAAPVVYVGTFIFLINVLISLGYYLPLLAALFMVPARDAGEPMPARIPVSLWMTVPLVLLGLLVIGMGLYPGPWWTMAAWAIY